ncbi:MAG TPA: beta-ketoacyl synthase N-terminal-like domain-containing protein, partial [Rugosimonospora sp.]|nr:beta-ketoacyl synthase N-terminal-like domain-containing protein [Rugosimonospora sp.]
LGRPSTGPRDAVTVALDGLCFPPRDLERAHAQQVLLLQAAGDAAAGRTLPRERTAVIVGMGVDPEVARYPVTQRVDGATRSELTAADVLGAMPNLVANRVNVQLDLVGPGYTVSAEEASGLVAVDLACRALRAGEVDSAVVGAVDLSAEPVHQAAVRALGRDREPGDAAVVMILERLADARRAGRPVIAVLTDEDTGDGPGLLIGDSGGNCLDPADLFGTAHAAYGLVALATAATAVSHRVYPRAGGFAEPSSREVVARVAVRPLEGAPVSVTLRPGDPARPWISGPAPRLWQFSGADRAAVLAALDSGHESDPGPARLVLLGDVHSGAAERVEAARRWLTRGGPQPDGVAYRDAPVGGEVAFVFTNGSAAYAGMGAELALAFPDLARAVEYGRFPAGRLPVLDQIWEAARLSAFHADLTRGLLGLRPAAAIGYSSGESAALAALGAWPDRAELLRDLRASGLFHSGLTGEFRVVREAWRRLGLAGTRWVSYLVSAPASVVREALHGAAAVHLMAVNEPGSCVIGGEEASCAEVLRRLGTAAAYPLDYEIAAHAPELAAVRDEYRALHLRSTRDVPGVRFYSGATGEAYRATAERAADAIVAQALRTVDFVRLIENAWRDGVRVFLEHGPQAQCTGWIRRILGEREHLAVALDAPGGRAVPQLCQAVAELVAAGVPVAAGALLEHLAGAAGPAAPERATIRLPAHPPPLRLPDPDQPAVMARAPELPPVLPDPASTVSDGAGLPSAPDAGGLAGVRPPPVGSRVAEIVAAQFARVSTVHREFLVAQAETHAEFLAVRQRTLTALTRARPQPETRPVPRTFTRTQLEQLAAGRISEYLGPRFAPLDRRSRVTRLPEPPMLLVDRVTGIDAEPGSMGTGTIWTETDVVAGAWYLDATGRMPAGLMVEAGQADLLLISWLGVDLTHPGDRVYRLLGCELTFYSGPAAPGETLRYDIHVDEHAEHEGVRLFFFHYDCRVGDRLRMVVRGGQAGFFTDAELAGSAGLSWEPGPAPPDAPLPVAVPDRQSFGPEQVRAFAEGRPADCFGPEWTVTRAHVRSPRTGAGRMQLLGAVTECEPARGYLRAETGVTPYDWFFAGHFTNDPCMPGTLMFEGGLQAMAFYLAACGYTIERDGWRFEPVPDRPVRLRCRGQVTPDSRRIVYEVFVRRVSVDPFPTLYADVLGTVDGVRAFHAENAGLRLVPDWPWHADGDTREDHAALLACAWGPLARAMGSPYQRFDETGRRAPRLPGPPYHMMSRIVAVDGERGAMRTGAAVTADYDVPADAWYFAQHGGTMPFAVLLEVALQPCGWLAMYLGSVLESDVDLLFRNLDGTGTVWREVRPETGTLHTHAECRTISRLGSTIIESFHVRCTAGDETVFEADTVFGFFPKEAFADQPGLPPSDAELAVLSAPGNRLVDLADSPLSGSMIRMIDRIVDCRPDGGSRGLGYVRAEKDIDPDEWYFKAHFFQDPVQPGSLGLQAMANLLRWYLLDRGAPAGRFEPVATGQQLSWKYRGQVTPVDGRITVELDVTALGVDERGWFATADGWLWVDGRRIYQVTGLGMRASPRIQSPPSR